MKKLQLNRFFIFFIALISLSKFFEAGRLISEEQTFSHVPMSFISLAVFFISMLALTYWIYEDEKNNNNVKNEFGLFEWIYKKRSSK